MRVGDLSFVVIERGTRLGLRVRDSMRLIGSISPGFCTFPMILPGEKKGASKHLQRRGFCACPMSQGAPEELSTPGELVFSHLGRECRLVVAEEPGDDTFFVLFRDMTNGRATYGSGRFLYVAKPGPESRVTIDFNRSFTPPCGFTRYATCPLVPETGMHCPSGFWPVNASRWAIPECGISRVSGIFAG